jgi:ubiquinone/menaquinone biosynthesis C-methylase UbiE
MSSQNDYPEYFARFYDVIYNSIRQKADHDFFMKKILAAKGPVLDVGCGTGRFFVEALKKGADIYGIDSSSHMIDVLKSKIKESDHHRVSVQNFTELYHDLKFDLIIAPFRVMSHLLTVEDQQAAINKIYAHLNPWGTFIFDLYVPDPNLLANGMNNVTDFEGEYAPGKKLKRITSSSSDIVNQLNDVTMQFIWDENGKEKNETWNMQLRFYFRYEIEHLIARSKLKMVGTYGGYDESPLDKNSKDFVVICQKLGMLPR